ncbi:hypothetical protein OF83DRAFT_1178261 [Amylostereum chailletii]|nr:hypothetical protein OF83DRAFT_1178261 [Amylostereum chailletii]
MDPPASRKTTTKAETHSQSWYLTTLAVAEQLYDALLTWNQIGNLNATSTLLAFFQQFNLSVAVGMYVSSSATYSTLTTAMKTFADGFVAVVEKYMSIGGLAEQCFTIPSTCSTSGSDGGGGSAGTVIRRLQYPRRGKCSRPPHHSSPLPGRAPPTHLALGTYTLCFVSSTKVLGSPHLSFLLFPPLSVVLCCRLLESQTLFLIHCLLVL